MLIRTRNRQGDNRYILRMIEEELIPYAKEARPDTTVSRTEIYERLRKGKVWVLSREANGKPVGFVLFHKRGEELLIEMLAVDRKYQSCGFGGRLMDAVEQFGRRNGCKSAKLFVDEPNPSAQKFYSRRGYVISDYYLAHRCFSLSKSLH
ncbi:GNAT family N-acetyltransferase [Paenibacillus sp. J2TS4]|uniref:GNAT family N-acetyltransferase n=1 Tax=Paenibacillus sp. J2TS4 TaxID=2807194 RepID=UPI001B1A1998|nr:GNAT family N-acetyltransferase [Paenibacillus sp. J2TS4]GIP31073.1 hypothetical protein J2TS4_02830 [Paenibacillus sp. J2TS4]